MQLCPTEGCRAFTVAQARREGLHRHREVMFGHTDQASSVPESLNGEVSAMSRTRGLISTSPKSQSSCNSKLTFPESS